MMKSESYNMNLFDQTNTTTDNKLSDAISAIELDSLSPKDALDTLYKLKEIS